MRHAHRRPIPEESNPPSEDSWGRSIAKGLAITTMIAFFIGSWFFMTPAGAAYFWFSYGAGEFIARQIFKKDLPDDYFVITKLIYAILATLYHPIGNAISFVCRPVFQAIGGMVSWAGESIYSGLAYVGGKLGNALSWAGNTVSSAFQAISHGISNLFHSAELPQIGNTAISHEEALLLREQNNRLLFTARRQFSCAEMVQRLLCRRAQQEEDALPRVQPISDLLNSPPTLQVNPPAENNVTPQPASTNSASFLRAPTSRANSSGNTSNRCTIL